MNHSKTLKYIPACLLISIMTLSCEKNEIISSEEGIAQEKEIIKDDTRTQETEMMEVDIKAANTTQALTLEIYSVRLMNITTSDEKRNDDKETPYLCQPGDTVEVMKSSIAEKDLGFKYWDGTENPLKQDKAYAIVMCRIMQGNIPIWCGDSAEEAGEAYAEIEPDNEGNIIMTLKDNSNWTGIINGRMARILNPITFDPTVDKWK